MEKKVIVVLVIVLAFAGLLIWGYGKGGNTTAGVQGVSQSAAAASALSASATSYDLGNMPIRGGKVEHEFTITNPTNAPITIKRVITSCMCTTAFLLGPLGGSKGPFGMEGMGYNEDANETLAPGESRTLRVVFDPAAHGPAGVGAIDRYITLTDATGGTLNIEVKGMVTP